MTTPSSNGKPVNPFVAVRAILQSTLSSAQKCTLLAIADRAGNGTSVCTASYDRLGLMTNRTGRRVMPNIPPLVTQGWIIVESRQTSEGGDTSNEIRLGPTFFKAVENQARIEILLRGGRVTKASPGEYPKRHPGGDGSVTQTSPLNVSMEREKKQTTDRGRSPRDPGEDDEPEESSSSVISLSPSRKESQEDGEHEARRQHWLARVMALGLRVSKSNPVLMTREKALAAIDKASERSPGGLQWVAWAIVAAEKRRNPLKGRKPTEYWSYIGVTLQNFVDGKGEPGESWPGESATQSKPSTSCCDPSYNPRA